jgi:HEAT repeat protein
LVNHPAPPVLESVAEALGEVGDEVDIPMLRKMLNDPWVVGNAKRNYKQIYPVREAAQKALEKIQKRTK